MSRAVLIDLTRCVGCRSCQIACKKKNKLGAEDAQPVPKEGGYQSLSDLSPRTFTLVTSNEVQKDNGEVDCVFAKRQCMHCLEPSCASACLVKAMHKTPGGPVVYDESLCMGCRYCMIACPYNIPKFEYDKAVPAIKKCQFCCDLQEEGEKPACTGACPTGTLKFGDRDELLNEARSRVYGSTANDYFPYIYGESDAGGSSWLYISKEPFAALSFPDVGTAKYPNYTKAFLTSVPLVIIAWAGLLTGFYWVTKRREELAEVEAKVRTTGMERSTL